MNVKVIKEWLNDIATPTGISYSGDQTISESMVKNIVDYVEELEQQCKKQKVLIDRILNETKETRDILNNNRDDNILSKSCLLSYLEIVEDLLKEVSE